MNWEFTAHILTSIGEFIGILILIWGAFSKFKSYISSEIGRQIGDLRKDVSHALMVLSERVESQSDRTEGLSDRMESLSDRTESLSQRMEDRFDGIETTLEILSKQVAHIGTFCDQLEADTIALDRRLIVLETKQEENTAHMHQGRVSHFSQSPVRRGRRGRGNPDAS